MRKLILLVALSGASLCFGGLILNNGGPNGQGGNEMTEWLQAEDFTLGPGLFTLTDIRFWDSEQAPGYAGSITWQIYSDNAGPSTLLFSNTVVPTRVVDPLANTGALNGFQNDFSIGAVPLLGNTTYWLALHNGPPGTTTRDEFYWSTTNTNGTSTGMENIAPFADNIWTPNGQEHAFELFGTNTVPEPGGLALIGLGIMGIGALGRYALAAVRNRK